MKSIVTFLSGLSILFMTAVTEAAPQKYSVNCKLYYRLVDSDGEYVPGSRVEGPSVDLAFDAKKVEFKGFTFEANINSTCSAIDPNPETACTAHGFAATLSKNGTKSEMNAPLAGAQMRNGTTQSITLTTESKEMLNTVCKVNQQ